MLILLHDLQNDLEDLFGLGDWEALELEIAGDLLGETRPVGKALRVGHDFDDVENLVLKQRLLVAKENLYDLESELVQSLLHFLCVEFQEGEVVPFEDLLDL